MKIIGLAHYGYCVVDINRTIDFYTNIMGFKMICGPVCSDGDDETCAALGFENHDKDCVVRNCTMENDAGMDVFFGPLKEESEEDAYLWIFVRDPDGIYIELIQKV